MMGPMEIAPPKYCPACAGKVIVGRGPVLDSEGTRVARFALCTRCPVISEMAEDVLLDLPGLCLEDLEAPFVLGERPCFPAEPVRMSRGDS